MKHDLQRTAAQLQRELDYYRRECNDSGARVLRLQEEQSKAFREARRSRTVVKLLREAYRLGDRANTMHDFAGPMLELVVDNALCDRAALLREEPLGSGCFILTQAIGLSDVAIGSTTRVRDAPEFLFTTAATPPASPASEITEVLGLSYVLWAFDQSSGHALVIGNRLESNVNRPFEAADQELIESALSVYLDVLYRKQADTQLRQAKRLAEDASHTRARVLQMLGSELSGPLRSMAGLAGLIRSDQEAGATTVARASEIEDAAGHLLTLLDDALVLAETDRQTFRLDVGWVVVEEIVRVAVQVMSNVAATRDVELEVTLPRRRTSICVDRGRIQQVVQHLIEHVLRTAPLGGVIRIAGNRRGDGRLELVVAGGRGDTLKTAFLPSLGGSASRAAITPSAAPRRELLMARQLVEAHGGTLQLENDSHVLQARLILPAEITRDDGPMERDWD